MIATGHEKSSFAEQNKTESRLLVWSRPFFPHFGLVVLGCFSTSSSSISIHTNMATSTCPQVVTAVRVDGCQRTHREEREGGGRKQA